MTASRQPRRKLIRMQGYGYSAGQSYFFTICTDGRARVLSHIDRNGEVHDTSAGAIVHGIWHALPDRFAAVQLDAFIVMPDHVHGIVTIMRGPDDDTANSPSLIRVINAFKSLSAIAINRELGRRGVAVWQRSFHDRVIRNDEEFARLCWYIEENPARWAHRTAEGETSPAGRL